jgi:hypothetical protein
MHMMHASFTTTGKKKTKQKFKSAAHAARARENAENWKRLLEKYDVKPQVRKPTKLDSNHSNVTVYRRECGTNNIPSLDTGKAVAPKKEIQQYTGDAMIGIGQLHKSNAVPIFSKEDAIDISKMRRG